VSHGVWWLPVGTVLGTLLMVFPAFTNLNIVSLGRLVGLKPTEDPVANRPQHGEHRALPNLGIPIQKVF
jgi:hypothetical protein